MVYCVSQGTARIGTKNPKQSERHKTEGGASSNSPKIFYLTHSYTLLL